MARKKKKSAYFVFQDESHEETFQRFGTAPISQNLNWAELVAAPKKHNPEGTDSDFWFSDAIAPYAYFDEGMDKGYVNKLKDALEATIRRSCWTSGPSLGLTSGLKKEIFYVESRALPAIPRPSDKDIDALNSEDCSW